MNIIYELGKKPVSDVKLIYLPKKIKIKIIRTHLQNIINS